MENVNAINPKLATACQRTSAACCRKGQLFIPDRELAALRAWLEAHPEEDRQAFEARLTPCEGFALYDQQDACQFLNEDNRCRLHADKVKPSECFWWPLHVYRAADQDQLEVRVSTSCCQAHTHITADSTLVDDVVSAVDDLGADLFYRFRAVYQGSYSGRPLRKIP